MNRIKNIDDIFKQCTCCDFVWKTRDEFLNDPTIEIQAYQTAEIVAGIFLFNHKPCGTTLGLSAEKLKDLYGGRLYEACVTDSKECSFYVEKLKNDRSFTP